MKQHDSGSSRGTPESETGETHDLIRKQTNRHQREVFRLRNTVSFRLGKHLTDAVRQPWRLVFLPVTFPVFAFFLGLERIGKRNQNSIEGPQSRSRDTTNCVVLFPTNGVGFGHFTRMYALARKLREVDPATEIIFFTPMPTLHIPFLDDFPTYHIAGRYKFKNMSSSQWNGLIEEQLLLIFETHRPKLFFFDGAFPYRGMLNAISRTQEMKRVWVRRGMFKKGSSIPVDSMTFFDTVVHPGDAIFSEHVDQVEHQTNVLHVPPILLADTLEKMTREQARQRLGVPSDATVWYLQLGAGQINDIESEISLTLKALAEHGENTYVVLGESLLGQRQEISSPNVRVLRDYPNALYFEAFDFAVQAGGYNSFHEMRTSGIPTVFYPNLETGMDDQLARCNVAVEEGWGVVVRRRNESSIQSAIRSCLEIKKSDKPIENQKALNWVNNLV
jgi:UDP-N-acetylglucosamine--N-acetylmuramyl-(pentapeptide) pyrophosphoryl-undecaprenol N-acetylglucosamine transferase